MGDIDQDLPELTAADAEVERLRAELADREARLKTVSKGYMDLQVEWTAFRDRAEATAKFRTDQLSFQVVSRFLDPVENLRRSLDAGTDDATALLDGCRIVHAQFMEELIRLGLRPVPGVGEPFDPAKHEAVAMVDVEEASQDGTVVQVLSDGYLMGTRTVRAARVVTGQLRKSESAGSG